MFNLKKIRLYKILILKWGLGIGDWGLGIGDWGVGPIHKSQSPITNYQYLFFNFKNKK